MQTLVSFSRPIFIISILVLVQNWLSSKNEKWNKNLWTNFEVVIPILVLFQNRLQQSGHEYALLWMRKVSWRFVMVIPLQLSVRDQPQTLQTPTQIYHNAWQIKKWLIVSGLNIEEYNQKLFWKFTLNRRSMYTLKRGFLTSRLHKRVWKL